MEMPGTVTGEDYILHTLGYYGTPVRCRVRVFDTPYWYVFLLTDLAASQSVTNLAEDLCTDVWNRAGRPPVEDCQFIEHYGYGGYNRLNLLTRRREWDYPETFRRILPLFEADRRMRVHSSIKLEQPGAFVLPVTDGPDDKWRALSVAEMEALIGRAWAPERRP